MSTVQDTEQPVDALGLGPRLEIDNLEVSFRRNGTTIHSVRDVSMQVGPGEIVALVGESGSGKSVLGLSVLGLLPADAAPSVRGRVAVCGTDMVAATATQRRAVRRQHLGAVFQDPMTSLNPTMRIGDQVAEAAGSRVDAQHVLELVRLPAAKRRMRAYPHELSGGQRQRVMIAMAIAAQPDLIVADEPTTALDVTVQSQILALLSDLRDEIGCSVLLVTHDYAVAAQIADRVAVMYGGRMMEFGDMGEVLSAPSHPYTHG
ncbi:MAG: ABC transporter ATP-binding protein, partial [Mycobacterium sp.]